MAAVAASTIERVVERIGPHRLRGAVVMGFQRGSKQLGWPTANLDPKAFEHTLDAETEGVYVGWASIGDPKLPEESRAVHKAVLSIGWNVRATIAPAALPQPALVSSLRGTTNILTAPLRAACRGSHTTTT